MNGPTNNLNKFGHDRPSMVRFKVVRDTVADYCRDKIERSSAIAILKLSGMSAEGAVAILDAADRNLTLKAAYKP